MPDAAFHMIYGPINVHIANTESLTADPKDKWTNTLLNDAIIFETIQS